MLLVLLLLLLGLLLVRGKWEQADNRSAAGSADAAGQPQPARVTPMGTIVTEDGNDLPEVDSVPLETDEDFARFWGSLPQDAQARLEEVNQGEQWLKQNLQGYKADAAMQELDETLTKLKSTRWHEAGLQVGEALDWQLPLEFDSAPWGLSEISLHNLDSDPPLEGLMLHHEGYVAIELDSGEQRSLFGKDDTTYIEAVWDRADGGAAEFFVQRLDAEGLSFEEIRERLEEHLVLDIRGNVLLELSGGAAIFEQFADMDGDGDDELLLYHRDTKSQEPRLWAINRAGEELWSTTDTTMGIVFASGDFDCDGMDELLSGKARENPMDGVDRIVVGIGQEPTEFPVEDARVRFNGVRSMGDLDGDGYDDIVSDGLIVFTGAGRTEYLNWPHGWNSMWIAGIIDMVHPLWYRHEQVLIAVLSEGISEYHSDTFVIWNLKGEIIYQQTFGEELFSLEVDRGSNTIALLSSHYLRVLELQ